MSIGTNPHPDLALNPARYLGAPQPALSLPKGPDLRTWVSNAFNHLQSISNTVISTRGGAHAAAISQPYAKLVISTEGGASAAVVEKPASLPRNSPSPNRTAHSPHSESGLTLVELIICVAIVAVLASAAIPIARFQVKREKERELRRDLWEIRDAIDRYKDAADKGAMQIKADSYGYPPDLETLVNGVEIQDKKVKFLRRIPVDPMTGTAEWGLRSNQDDVDSDSFGGQNVFDVHTKSTGTAIDGTKYSTW